jgi:hypothetical protein
VHGLAEACAQGKQFVKSFIGQTQALKGFSNQFVGGFVDVAIAEGESLAFSADLVALAQPGLQNASEDTFFSLLSRSTRASEGVRYCQPMLTSSYKTGMWELISSR